MADSLAVRPGLARAALPISKVAIRRSTCEAHVNKNMVDRSQPPPFCCSTKFGRIDIECREQSGHRFESGLLQLRRVLKLVGFAFQ